MDVLRPSLLLIVSTLITSAPTQPSAHRLRASPTSHTGCVDGNTSLAMCSQADTLAANAISETAFSISHTGQGAQTYAVTCDYTSPVTGCALDSTEVTVAAGASHAVVVRYQAGSTQGDGLVTVNINGGSVGLVTGEVTVSVGSAQ